MWLPLAVSVMLMTGEILLVQAAVGRLPDEKVMLAALGIMFWTEVLIEAPVIMLLSTSTALTTTAQAYRVVRRFTIHMNLLVTGVAVAIAFVDPLFDLVLRRWMGIPPEIADLTQTGMRIMSLWSAAIGWRRFHQGMLIRFGEARQVTWGTVVRLVTSATVASGLVLAGRFSGIVVAATTFLLSAVAEALYAWWRSRAIVAQLHANKEPEGDDLTYRTVLEFHTPLAATSVLSFVALPLLNGGLARMPAPQDALAAWPVLYSVILLFRGPGIALPEVVIALLKTSHDIGPLRRFCWLVTGLSTLGLMLASVTPILPLYLRHVLAVSADLAELVLAGALVSLLIPGLAALSSMYRGMLMAHRSTPHIYWGMMIYLVATVSGVALGVVQQSPGIITASIAITVATLLETAYLGVRSRVTLRQR
jgi:progressive ankylosis protein